MQFYGLLLWPYCIATFENLLRIVDCIQKKTGKQLDPINVSICSTKGPFLKILNSIAKLLNQNVCREWSFLLNPPSKIICFIRKSWLKMALSYHSSFVCLEEGMFRITCLWLLVQRFCCLFCSLFFSSFYSSPKPSGFHMSSTKITWVIYCRRKEH